MQTVRFATTAGIDIVGDVAGPEDGALVLFAHGGGQTRASWRKPFADIAAKGYRVVSIDGRGHGDSDWAPDGDYALESLSRDMRDVLRTLAAPAVVIGASLGGLTALYLAGEPDAPPLRGLALVDVTPRLNPEGVERITSFMRAYPHGFDSLEDVADAVAKYNPHRPRPTDVSGLRRNLREVEGRLFWHWDPQFLSSSRTPNVMLLEQHLDDIARSLTVPTLLVRGRQSDLVREEEAAHFRALMPQAEFVDVHGAGHMVAGDDNDAFAAAVLSFLERLPG